MKPSVGRVVHFVVPEYMGEVGGHRAAIITRVHSETCINAHVFFDGDKSQAGIVTSICLDAEGKTPYSWHWPERVD